MRYGVVRSPPHGTCTCSTQASGPRTRKRLRRALPGRSVTGRSRSFHTAGDRPRRRNSRRMLADASNPPARPPRHESRPAGVAALISLCHLAMLAWELQRLLHCTPPPLAGRPASRLVSCIRDGSHGARWSRSLMAAAAVATVVAPLKGGGTQPDFVEMASRALPPPSRRRGSRLEPPRARRTDERRI